jgi:N-methylhydantoinase A/oxoprolinase/acetone carboxylase beta subunit
MKKIDFKELFFLCSHGALQKRQIGPDSMADVSKPAFYKKKEKKKVTKAATG